MDGGVNKYHTKVLVCYVLIDQPSKPMINTNVYKLLIWCFKNVTQYFKVNKRCEILEKEIFRLLSLLNCVFLIILSKKQGHQSTWLCSVACTWVNDGY